MILPTDCLYYLVSRSTLLATAVLRRELANAASAGVKPAYLGVLLALWGRDGLRSADLGRRAGLEPSSMTGLLDRMERDGLIQRQPDPDDRRAQRIVLTEAGRAAEGPVLVVVDQVLGRLTQDLPQEDIEVTKRTLQRFIELGREERR